MPLVEPPVALVTTPLGTFGELATAAFALAALSGVALAIPYDVQDAPGSIAAMLLANPAAVFFRSLHYWTGQACFVLSLLHVWDHLRKRTEQRVTAGVWLRLVVTLPILAFLMLSGFVLRGDAEGRQALRIVAEATGQLPALGPLLATLLFGAAERLDIVYLQHAATATILVWLFIVEHGRRMWPRVESVVAVLAATASISLFVSPGLHDGQSPIAKGPWYFLGLQEILHWTSWPLAVVAAGLAMLVALAAVRTTGPARAARVKVGLLALAAMYAALCGVGAVLRGENWAFGLTSPFDAGGLRIRSVFAPMPSSPGPLPQVMGRPEGCLVCHVGVTGLGNAHRPEAVGCASCHGGDPLTLDKTHAHRGMDLIPGNLANASRRCGQAACHPSIVPRVERSIMSTMSGIVAVNRSVFGEAPGRLPGPPHVRDLERTAADTHLRQLCASCHLGTAKDRLGPNGEDSRGGGCNACHLSYSAEALEALRQYERGRADGAPSPRAHPAISLDVANMQCFGCHSRSGRISTSYEGWHEKHDADSPGDPARQPASTTRTLADGRVFERVSPDIHHERGLDCIDCHGAVGVMGDGTAHARKGQPSRVACDDCHARPGRQLRTVPPDALDPESRVIVALRGWPADAAYGRAASGDALVNVVAGPDGRLFMRRKRAGDRKELRPALAVCDEGAGHQRLSCGACHTAWAPRCPTCHTTFDATAEGYDWLDAADVRGAWEERAGSFVADPPTLGVRRRDPGPNGNADVIETFVPGMILSIERPVAGGATASRLFRRLYARIEPHTTRRESRTCESCHNDPSALGYGRGTLRFEPAGAGGRWRFTPVSPLTPDDGLPADAWIPFLGTRTGMVSTRDDVRPFSVEEQRRILRVGACLTCHRGDSAVMRESVRNFEGLLRRIDRRCRLPLWE